MIQTVRVGEKGHDGRGEKVLADARHFGAARITSIRTATVYRLEGVDEDGAKKLMCELLVEDLTHEATLNKRFFTLPKHVLEVALKPGVMNPAAEFIVKAARNLGIELRAVDVSTEYAFYGDPGLFDIRTLKNLLVNDTVERIVAGEPETLIVEGTPGPIETVPLRKASEEELVRLSHERSLFLDLKGMRAMQEYFRKIGRDPTDAEVEAVPQSWSEHCYHGTFKNEIVADGIRKSPFLERLQKTAAKYMSNVLSAFKDNAGVVNFYDGWALTLKVETHNAPSALAPYGGAATGVGGVLRDVFGSGQGAERVILSTDIFCLASWDMPKEKIPLGCLDPYYMLKEVIRGVEEYGNRMGIPTANGSFHFHESFRAKPCVIVGAVGLIEADLAKKGSPRPGDKVIVVGGRTGRDGIHGATFSSGAMTDQTVEVYRTAVQIGNPIEEKRTFDFIAECTRRGLIRALTDCGAGGFSSAIGEMGSETGVCVGLEKAPLKYPGLAPWEIWLSESQERMVLAVAKEHVDFTLSLAARMNVEATVIGEFASDHKLCVTWNGETVVDLDMDFLHHGKPEQTLAATYVPRAFEEPVIAAPETPEEWRKTYKRMLSHPDICSKEPVVRLYDHGVQGGNVLSPFSGVNYDGPNDAVVLTPLLGMPYGVVASHGINPTLVHMDPYWGTLWAITEGIANYAAVGGKVDQDHAALVNNYIWPKPNPEALGRLDQCVDAVCDAMDGFKVPVISGKDSLGGTYLGKDGTTVAIFETLCMTVVGKVPNIQNTVTADLKKLGSKLLLLGDLNHEEMGGSVYYKLHGALGSRVPRVNPRKLSRVVAKLHELIRDHHILSCHDISEGGLGVALAEMCFGGAMGARIEMNAVGSGRDDLLFWNEMAGSFLIETCLDIASLGRLMPSLPWRVIGETVREKTITVRHASQTLFTIELGELKQTWQSPMKEVFGG